MYFFQKLDIRPDILRAPGTSPPDLRLEPFVHRWKALTLSFPTVQRSSKTDICNESYTKMGKRATRIPAPGFLIGFEYLLEFYGISYVFAIVFGYFFYIF